MAEKENKAPEPVHKPEEQKVTACMTLSKPRKRYMSSDSDSENGPPGALKRLEEPDGQCHPRKTSCYNEKTSETQVGNPWGKVLIEERYRCLLRVLKTPFLNFFFF